MPADAVRPVSSKMRARISLAVANAVLRPRRSCGDVEIGFVKRERLDQSRVVTEDGADLTRDSAVDVKPRWYEHQFGALPPGRGRRHGRAYAERASLVARRGYHSPHGAVANRDRTAAEFRVIALLDGRIERVHVDMDDLARRHAATISGREHSENHCASVGLARRPVKRSSAVSGRTGSTTRHGRSAPRRSMCRPPTVQTKAASDTASAPPAG